MKNIKGFTLIEVLVTIGIFAIAMGAITGFVLMSYRAQNYTIQQANAVDEARKGIQVMNRELREARTGDNGAYILEKADDHEIIFYSDIDKDGATERVRYFVYQSGFLNESDVNTCVAYNAGGSCNVSFDQFTGNPVDSAEVNICVEGDLNGGNEYIEIYADGSYLGQICHGGCSQCNGNWEGCTPFDVTQQASDGSIIFTADSSSAVGSWGGGFCDWQEENHAFKAKFDFAWTETDPNTVLTLRKEIIQPSEYPINYPEENEETSILSRHILNQLPIFKYYDGQGNELDAPARLEETKMIRTELIINVDPNRAPQNYYLESSVQIRNLKNNL